MDVPTSAAAWLLLGVVLGALALGAAVVAVAASRRRGRADPRPPSSARVDDLAGFFEHPPGSRPEAPRGGGWATLAPPPPAPPLPRATRPGHAGIRVGALCVVALALVGAVVAVTSGDPVPDPSPGGAGGAVPPRDGGHDPAVVGDLRVGGLVLETRAVGITAGYPELRLRVDDGTTRLELEVPTYNCLTVEPPPDPRAAGCAAALVERAVLTSPDLEVERTGDRLTLRGQAATAIHPAGSAPEPTGRVYDLELTVAPGGGPARTGVRSAVGELRLGTGTAPVLRAHSTLRTGS